MDATTAVGARLKKPRKHALEIGKDSHVLAAKKPCIHALVEQKARALGITCQEVFERAYLERKRSCSFGRAVFLGYLTTPSAKRKLPYRVITFCETTECTIKSRTRKSNAAICAGCQLDAAGINGLVWTYSLIFATEAKAEYMRSSGDLQDKSV
ncbi:MAG TPA: hypothetical protein VD928_02695 [Candidatus Paceibacterota bacterium]|nr:hypothetical protein [Candidatus Paceibacterota bacterium]